ncbi:MAG: glycosyltransferase [Cytophagales bacterium]|nr:glycosyltransferase [Cytophagales bacterium]
MITCAMKPNLKVLHVLSQVMLTGAETYAAILADTQKAHGYHTCIISQAWHTKCDTEIHLFPIAKRGVVHRIMNVYVLIKFIKKYKINIVHAHSRAASWVSYFACKWCQVPLISSVHGRQHIHKGNSTLDIYGNSIITVCEYNSRHLTDIVKINPQKIKVIPNGFDLSKFNINTKINATKTISVIGRSTGTKGDITKKMLETVMPDILTKYPDVDLQIIGGVPDEYLTENNSKILNKFVSRILFTGHVPDTIPYIVHSILVIGSGRVAIETLLSGVSLLALGEACCHGLVYEYNLKECMASNFGDMWYDEQPPGIDYSFIYKELCAYIEDKSLHTLSQNIKNTVAKSYDIRHVYANVEKEYLQLISQ